MVDLFQKSLNVTLPIYIDFFSIDAPKSTREVPLTVLSGDNDITWAAVKHSDVNFITPSQAKCLKDGQDFDPNSNFKCTTKVNYMLKISLTMTRNI